MIDRELDEDYFRELLAHLERLKFKRGVLASAELGKGNVGHNYVLRRWQRDTSRWWNRLFDQGPPTYWFHLHPRDEAGAQALGQLRNRVISRVATAAAQSADHVLSFFQVMKTEFAFLLGCVNLYERLAEKGEPICFPSAAPQGEYRLTGAGLYDACLALRTAKRVVGNELNGDKVRLVIITGANQGGKSTFLRAIGLAQILMQVGMFVPATAFTADVRDRLFTHFRREEDTAMEHGKLDEELRRMSDIVDRLTPASMVLCNESFGATNEREGSEIARQIVSALLEHDVKVAFVTHLTHFARGLFEQGRTDALFLRAERGPNGTRTFTLIPGAPLDTGYGQDLYREVFAA
jgi:DNA mismatch repair ATPase MutS